MDFTTEILYFQARFSLDTGVSAITTIWEVPITWTRGGDPDFTNLKPSSVLREQVTVLQRGTTSLEWVIFNKQQSG